MIKIKDYIFIEWNYEEQQFILKQMRMLQPCKIIDKINGE